MGRKVIDGADIEARKAGGGEGRDADSACVGQGNEGAVASKDGREGPGDAVAAKADSASCD